MDNCLHISYATDNNYLMYVGISMYSLFDNNKTFDSITVHIICNDISDKGKQLLRDIADEFERSVIFYDCSNIGEWLGDKLADMFKNTQTNVPITAYARLFLPVILDESISRVLYLDADSVILDSYDYLWNSIDVGNYSAMGVIDNVPNEAKKRIGLNKDYAYINSGVVLMNLSYMRENDFVTECKAFIEKYNGCVFHHDQGVINGVLSESIGYLPPKYNAMSFVYETKKTFDIGKIYGIDKYYSEQEIEEARNNPVFVHFTEGNLQRPWVNGCKHPLKDKWLYYKSKTIWKDVPLCADNRSIKLKILSWMRLNMPHITKIILRTVGK